MSEEKKNEKMNLQVVVEVFDEFKKEHFQTVLVNVEADSIKEAAEKAQVAAFRAVNEVRPVEKGGIRALRYTPVGYRFISEYTSNDTDKTSDTLEENNE